MENTDWSQYPVIRVYTRIKPHTLPGAPKLSPKDYIRQAAQPLPGTTGSVVRSIWSGDSDDYMLNNDARYKEDVTDAPLIAVGPGSSLGALASTGHIKVRGVSADMVAASLQPGTYLRLSKLNKQDLVQETLFLQINQLTWATCAADFVNFQMKFSPWPIGMDLTKAEFQAQMRAQTVGSRELSPDGFRVSK